MPRTCFEIFLNEATGFLALIAGLEKMGMEGIIVARITKGKENQSAPTQPQESLPDSQQCQNRPIGPGTWGPNSAMPG